MNTSESIKNIATALCKFQTQIKDAPKESQAHKYKYADLGTILELVRPVMADNELSAVQMPCNDGDHVGVTTRLMHTSGEWLESTLFMGVSASSGMSLAQSAGSVITYARRYSLAAVLGITQTDDDAVHVPPKKPAKKKTTASRETLATEKQKDLIQKADKIPPRRLSWLEAGDNFNKMTEAQAKVIISEIEELMK